MLLSEEQRLFKETTRGFLQSNAPVDALRKLRDNASDCYDKNLWQAITQLGIPAMSIPEKYGGLEFGYLGLGAVFEEMGRTLTASPLLSTVVLGASALELGGSAEQREDLLPKIASGELTLALAIDEKNHHSPLHFDSTLSVAGDEITLNAEKTFVVDGASADKLVVVTSVEHADRSAQAEIEDGTLLTPLSLVLVDGDCPSLTTTRTLAMDGRSYARVSIKNAAIQPEQIIGELGKGRSVLEQILTRGSICIAAEMMGGIDATFERTMSYLREREQFGVPIGSFQALQHRAAELFCQIELCRSAVLDAAAALDQGNPQVAAKASVAKALANDCYEHVTNEAVQMHGGMGVTDELDIGLFLKRARLCSQILGDSTYHRDRYAKLLGY